jgi:putative ABC transport system permease protein
LTVSGVVAGVALLYGLLFVAQPLILNHFGLFVGIRGLSLHELMLIGIICAAGLTIGIIPGYRIYRYSLADGMTIKI